MGNGSNTCVCCGTDIPEGAQICNHCEQEYRSQPLSAEPVVKHDIWGVSEPAVDIKAVLDELYLRMNLCDKESIATSYFAVAILIVERAAGISSLADGYPARVRKSMTGEAIKRG